MQAFGASPSLQDTAAGGGGCRCTNAAARRETSLEQGAADLADALAQPVLARLGGDRGGHDSRLQALRKKSGVPKLPDFKASASGAPPSSGSDVVQGTP